MWLLAALAVAVVIAGSAAAALLAWPTVRIGASTSGLAAVSLPGFSGHVESVAVSAEGGKPGEGEIDTNKF